MLSRRRRTVRIALKVIRAGLLVAAFVALLACSTPGAPPAPSTPQSVALQAGDLPRGMVRCGLSGDVDRFLTGAPSDNQYASQLAQEWRAMKALGAQAGYVGVYAGSSDQCKAAFTSQSLTGIRWAASMVVQFKNTAAAGTAYRQASIGAQQIAQQPGSEEGAATGLGSDSLTFSDSEGTQSLFFAYWHHARFLVVMLALDLGEQASHQAAHDVDSRIH